MQRLIPLTTSLALLLATVLPPVPVATIQAQTQPTRPVDTDINSYVLFASKTVSFKGGNVGDTGHITGGNVGANGIPGTNGVGANDATVNICDNAKAIMSDDIQVVGDTGAVCKRLPVLGPLRQQARRRGRWEDALADDRRLNPAYPQPPPASRHELRSEQTISLSLKAPRPLPYRRASTAMSYYRMQPASVCCRAVPRRATCSGSSTMGWPPERAARSARRPW